MAVVFLGIGSNQRPEENIVAGLVALEQQFCLEQVSPWYRSPAMGFDGPAFINLVVKISTDLSLQALGRVLKQLERDFGRAPDAVKFSSRTLDVDVLLYNDLVGEYEGHSLPRGDIRRCAFVLRPLLDIAPDLSCPSSHQRFDSFWPALALQPLEQITPPVDVEGRVPCFKQPA
ncbi:MULTISPECIES: 2-amino-4-hydroxy-6-hydroxymethyldihydropteridine diphosphokinase [unclassified Oceanobacter]|uniref:2-amino-4-hydroxy-6- hydroxymethyldihydropteridine diphosphokinase n=1 Tax=unclassified Oceanobacter TaxID=2620260 RepID=UPI002736DBAA|nr:MULTISPECIES: 2-amino-4-hydroxy-6-hydroxymethyldihydropteridine diphosphokinase [unclassified Oceanobacter]MDP2610456.1 2-amino-4-hydroxy-6-hydroxymethyldihydropteridine diphosphokinase [Oceanobacter sp. 1_MG-2023]MDP2613693.1 2-amino-4-hydroxy-6-hydroxymethyldihydropteridine diphosphokinase [Oceanobacter sp. 2_MG-2023]